MTAAAAAPAEFTLARPHAYNRTGAARWILSHVTPHSWIVGLLVLGAFGNAALAAMVPVLVGQAFDALLKPTPDVSVLLPTAIFIGLTQIGRGLLQLGRNFGAELLAQRLEREIREELYISLLGKSMTFHSLQAVGDTMARATNDVREINFMFSPGVNLVVGSLFFLALPLAVAPQYHPALLLTPAVFTVIYFVVLVRYLRTMAPITDEVRSSFGDMNTHLSESLDGVETVKGASQECAEVERFVTNARRVRDAFVRQGDLEARFTAFLFYGLACAAGLTHALLLLRMGLLDTGGVVAYFGLLRLLEFPTFTSTWAYTQVSLGFSSARRVLALINRETDLDQNALGAKRPLRGEIEFRHVDFAYPGGEPILKDISFKVKPGQTVAIVGQTGAGKTSLVKLINRTYDVSRGQVCVDGVDVRDWNLAALRSQISMIEQDVFLFSRSVADNIAFGNPEAEAAEVEAAADTAQAHDFIQSFENGYATVIGERGVTLSGGQRQRLALARAFLTRPALLILDDSTSAIDSATEDKIQRAIANAAHGRTMLIITHRLSQIRWADHILVLRQGRIVAQGTHAELLASSEAYRRIFRE